MAMIKCPVCGREVEIGTRFCAWCGSSLSQNPPLGSENGAQRSGGDLCLKRSQPTSGTVQTTNSSVESQPNRHEWPEEEKPVSFTVYESEQEKEQKNIYSKDMLEGDMDEDYIEKSEDSTPRYGGWQLKHVAIILVMLIVTLGLVFLFQNHHQSEYRLPDYNRVIQKQEQQTAKREQLKKAKEAEAIRIQEELRRIEEAKKAEEEEARRLEEEMRMSVDEDELDAEYLEEQLEERLEELLQNL